MRASTVQYIIKHDIDNQTSNGCDQHDGWFCHKLLLYDPFSGLVHDEENHRPDYEDIEKGTDQLHAMIAKGSLLVHLFLGEIQEDKGENEANEVTYQMDGIRYDGNRFGDLASDDLKGYEKGSNDDDYYQSSIIA